MLEEYKLSASTIVCYKSALIGPLLFAFSIDLNYSYFSRIFKSMFLKNPSVDPTELRWDLLKVVDLLNLLKLMLLLKPKTNCHQLRKLILIKALKSQSRTIPNPLFQFIGWVSTFRKRTIFKEKSCFLATI